MATQVKQNGIIAKTKSESAAAPAKRQPSTIKEYIMAYQNQIAKALPSVMTPERFTRIALSAVSNTPQLAECTPNSFVAAMMNAAQLGLEPNTPLGQAYLIPFRNNKKGVIECQFQIGYKGLIDLAYRSGDVRTVQAHIVYENDEFEFEYGLEPQLKHIPAKENRGDAVWVYAVFKLVNGGEGFEVMSMEDVRAHARKYSKAYNSGPWQTNFDEMAKKTIIKRVLKYAPMKTEFVRGAVADETVSHIDLDAEDDTPIIQPDYTIIDSETGEVLDQDDGATADDGGQTSLNI